MRIPQPLSATAYVHVYMYVLRAGGQSGSSALERNWWHRGGPAAGAGLCN